MYNYILFIIPVAISSVHNCPMVVYIQDYGYTNDKIIEINMLKNNQFLLDYQYDSFKTSENYNIMHSTFITPEALRVQNRIERSVTMHSVLVSDISCEESQSDVFHGTKQCTNISVGHLVFYTRSKTLQSLRYL